MDLCRHTLQYEQGKARKIELNKNIGFVNLTKEGKALSKINHIMPYYSVFTFKE